ncbi:hypothetical protein Z517_04638 [Fonsecaea pedrosoi CBS 271.37]|uniref:Unplaced genomic scaffold supercont1.3, whole genome shotgun sequence n=1 Tax=Fonsecaea pedrosoi CBS 271.37 TaxID=1442368 RepID=A0A0D2F4N3_9EURO|nr:uncharacterized protein Z517_04638 [Fonsecaea pedrosoi CBS 271.37]KIW81612.1 hypothetical protein Z517_04638 [Fonsecaea pedrosoi CBS 271.37]
MASSSSSSSSSPKTFTSPSKTSSPQNTMPARDRSAGRNVHIYDLNDPTTVIGGLRLLPGITNANFYAMIEIIVIFPSPFSLQNENETTIERDDHPLQPGKYYIVAKGSFELNNEPWLVRTISLATGTRVAAFAEAIRSRDRQCIISGAPVPTFNGISFWDSFEAAHIFPLAYEGHWKTQDYSRWITIQPEKGGSINSVQNGLLLRRDIHSQFDAYLIAINPDDNYKVVAFGPAGENIEGRFFELAAPIQRWQRLILLLKTGANALFQNSLQLLPSQKYLLTIPASALKAAEEDDILKIIDPSYVASYNWLARVKPTILVSGSPSRWAPPCSSLKPDRGTYFRDKNASQYAAYSTEPAVRALFTLKPDFDGQEVDLCHLAAIATTTTASLHPPQFTRLVSPGGSHRALKLYCAMRKHKSFTSKARSAKIRFCGEQAKKDNVDYFWVDICRINKANNTQYFEAINSLSRYYRNAVKCYVYWTGSRLLARDINSYGGGHGVGGNG